MEGESYRCGGLAVSRRDGKPMLYELTERGRSLLDVVVPWEAARS